MSRYSPTVLPRATDYTDFSGALLNAFQRHRELNRQKVLEERQDQQYAQGQEEYDYRKAQRPREEARQAEADAVREAQMHDAGFRRADEVEHVAQQGAPVTGALVRDLQGQAVQPVDPRYERYSGDLYRDPNETPLARELRKQQAVFSQVHAAEPDDYPEYVQGLDYTKELQGVLAANRARERDQARDQAAAARDETRAREQRALEEYRQGQITKRSGAGGGGRLGGGRGPGGLTRNEALNQARDLLTTTDPETLKTTRPDADTIRALADELYEGRRGPTAQGDVGEISPVGGGVYRAAPVQASPPARTTAAQDPGGVHADSAALVARATDAQLRAAGYNDQEIAQMRGGR